MCYFAAAKVVRMQLRGRSGHREITPLSFAGLGDEMKASKDVTRRNFLKGAGLTAGIGLGSLSHATPGGMSGATVSPGTTRVTVQENKIHIESRTLTATIDRGFITSLRSKASGEEFIQPFDFQEGPALSLIYPSSEEVPISDERFGQTTARQLSTTKAEMIVQHWNGDGVLTFSVDPETGDLIIETSAYSSRPGVRACRWYIRGIGRDLNLVAPFYQGVKLSLDDNLISNSRWEWPKSWEAALAILQSSQGGFWIHAQDENYRYKSLQIGSEATDYCLGFDTEAYGPIDDNLAAGGLRWRVNVFSGDWRTPAARYRDWLWRVYRIDRVETHRQDWIHDVRLAMSWCPTDLAILDALSTKVDPRKVLLHLPRWRTDPYDENYPDFIASPAGRQFISRGREMGFRIMPHFNSIDMDPTHPVYARVRDFQFRKADDKTLWGWSWIDGRYIGVPESNHSRTQHRRHKVMVKIHPGLSTWRSILSERVQNAARDLDLQTVFLDVTLNTGNLDNCLVENMTSSEGMNRLIHEIGELSSGLVVGGEGLNETTFSGVSFGQVHLFRSAHSNFEGLERTGGCDLNNFLFGKITHTFGYSRLSGRSEEEQLRMRIHEEHGAIPTITVRTAEEISNPNPTMKRVLERAAG